MAPTSKKRGAPASTSKKQVRPSKVKADKAKAAEPVLAPGRLRGSKKAQEPTRAVKKVINKELHAAASVVARSLSADVVVKGMSTGQAIVGTKPLPPQPKWWRKPTVEWTDELGEDLFVLMSTGHGLRAIAELEGMPSHFQMIKWLANETHPFSAIRARALKNLIPYYEELAREITLTSNSLDIKIKRQVLNKEGEIVDIEETRTVDNVERSKLAFVGLQWTLSHIAPKKHGRNANPTDEGPNKQLEGLFNALKAGPVE